MHMCQGIGIFFIAKNIAQNGIIYTYNRSGRTPGTFLKLIFTHNNQCQPGSEFIANGFGGRKTPGQIFFVKLNITQVVGFKIIYTFFRVNANDGFWINAQNITRALYFYSFRNVC